MLIPVPVQTVQPGEGGVGCLVFVEALALAVWVGMKVSTQASSGWDSCQHCMHGSSLISCRRWLFYLAAANVDGVVGYLGFRLGASIWPQDHVWQATFAVLDCLITLVDRLAFRSWFND